MRKYIFLSLCLGAFWAKAQNASPYFDAKDTLLKDEPLSEFNQDGKYEYAKEINDLEAKPSETQNDYEAFEKKLDESIESDIADDEAYLADLQSQDIETAGIFVAPKINNEATSNQIVVVNRMSLGSLEGMRFYPPQTKAVPLHIGKLCQMYSGYLKSLDKNHFVICGKEVFVPQKFINFKVLKGQLPQPKLYFYMQRRPKDFDYTKVTVIRDSVDPSKNHIATFDDKRDTIFEDIFNNY